MLEMKKKPDPKLVNETCTGLNGRDEKLLQWITDSGLAVLMADNYAVELIQGALTDPLPKKQPWLPLHEHCLFKNGIHLFFFSSRRRHTRCLSDWSSDVCSSDLIAALRLGSVGFAFMPGEVFVELAREVEAASPLKPTRVIGLTNGAMGYIPTRQAYARSEERRVGKECRSRRAREQ